MANEKNNINELVSDDEDPTAELEAITFRQANLSHDPLLRESDENTAGFSANSDKDAKTIGKLQYDIEQLRSKWLGLEAEIKAREELTDKLNAEMDELRESISRKTKLLKTRDQKIKGLKTEIRERDERHRKTVGELKAESDLAKKAARDIPAPLPATTDVSANEDHEQLARTQAYADSLRQKFQDILAAHEDLENERDRLQAALEGFVEKSHGLADELEIANLDKLKLDDKLASIADEHAEEIRILRFELGEAQDTVSQTEDLTYQLASDLVDTRGFKEELERMLSDADEKSSAHIEKLETKLAKMTRVTHDLEEKLESRSDAINVLLKELAHKSEQAEQAESIGDIGDVISDIDERISEQFDEVDESSNATQKAQDRVTRVLVGKIGDQLLRFPLFKDRLTIGRTTDNDIQLNAAYISRRHAVVQADGESTRVIDWGSKNGVYVNSKQVTEHFLENGDIVTIGNAHFRYEERAKRES